MKGRSAMRRTFRRWGVLAATVLTLSVGTVAAFPTPASAAAATDLGGAGGDMNVLPSVVAKTLPGDANKTARAQYLYESSRSSAYWREVKAWAKQTGATAKSYLTQDAVKKMPLTLEKSTTKIPLGAVTRWLGPAGTAITGYQAGTAITNNVGAWIGLDPEGYVCENTGSDLGGTMVRLLDGANCPDVDRLASYVPNTDAAGGTQSQSSCGTADEGCVAVVGTGSTPSGPAYCLSFTGGKYPTDEDRNWNTYVVYRYSDNGGPAAINGTGVLGYSARSIPSWLGCPSPSPNARTSYLAITKDRQIIALGFDTTQLSPITQTSGDPLRVSECIVLGGNNVQYSGPPLDYHESNPSVPIPKCPTLPAGVPMKSSKIVTHKDGETDRKTMAEVTASPEVTDFQTQYPGCTTNSVCALTLFKGDRACVDTTSSCDGWYSDPNKTSTYTCKYGVPGSQELVDLAECNVYRDRFSADAENTGDKITDPDSGDTIANPKPSNDDGTASAIEGTPHDKELGPYNCFPSGWGVLNPVSWIIKPLKCLAIPRPGAVDLDLADYKKVADDTLPAKLSKTVGDYDFKNPGTGCSGIPVHLGGEIPDFTILSACPGDVLAPMAGWGRTFLDLAITVVGVFAITKFIAAPFGFTPLGKKEEDE